MKNTLRLFCLSLFLINDQNGIAAEPPEPTFHQQLDTYVEGNGEQKPLKTIEQWQVRKSRLLKNMQQVMGPLPVQPGQNLPVTYKILSTLSGEGFTRQTIQFAAPPGDDVIADLYLPEIADKSVKSPGIVALHPTGVLGKRIIAGEGPLLNRQYAKELAQRGYVVICPDYPSFGDLKDYDFEADDYVSGTMKGIVNHIRCIDLLQSLPQVRQESIGVIGHSLGGHNALFLAIFDERVQAVVTSCGWTPFPYYYQGNLTGWTSSRYMPRIKEIYQLDPAKVPFDFPEIIAGLAPRGLFSSSPVDDSNFDVTGVRVGIEEARKIYDLYGKTDQLQLTTPLCEHDFPTETRADAYRFLDQQLSHTPIREIGYGDELPRIQALSPAEALKSFTVAKGLKIELTASEPDVVDPVAMSFDADGNLYVIEMRGYSEDDGQNLGRVRFLQDTNQDGIFDRSQVYAEGFSWPTAILCYEGGVFVGAAPDIYYLKDTDGDQQADQRKVVFTGFGKTNVQALINSFRWGLDNRIYGATSSNGGIVKRPDQPESEAINLSGRNFSFDPKTLELRPESGAAQHGMGFDDWGRLFVCSNSNHFQQVMYEDRYAARNRLLKAPAARISIAEDGAQAVVYRQSPVEPWRIVRTRLRASGLVKGAVEFGGKNSGYFTSATGVNFFRGTGWGENTQGTAIIGDVGSNIIHRKQVFPDGVQLKGVRVDEQGELVSSTDIWFRPVQYENGPDGALHVLDMYREVIEHPWSLPPEIKQHLDLTSGRDRGRLYRIVSQDFVQPESLKLQQADTELLVQLLDHKNAWQRETASRLLYERQDNSAAELIRRLYPKFSPLGLMHGLYVLSGLNQLRAEDLTLAWNSSEPQLRRHAIRLSEQFTTNAEVYQQLLKFVNDPAIEVRYQLAFTLGEFDTFPIAEPLAELLLLDAESSWICFAVYSSAASHLPELVARLATKNEFLQNNRSISVLEQLVELIARSQNVTAVTEFAQLLDGSALSQLKKQNLYRVYAANSRTGGEDAVNAPLETWRQAFLKQSRELAFDERQPLETRLAAVKALAVSDAPQDAKELMQLLTPSTAEQLQLTALETLGTLNAPGVAEYLLEIWPEMVPALRKAAQQALYSRPEWTTIFLQAVLDQEIPRSDVDRAQLQLTRTSTNTDIHNLGQQVTAWLQDSPRAEVIAKYRPALEMNGDINSGRQLFVKHCSSCHRLEGQGKPIGPNLASFRTRGKEALLINVLDPSREVTPEYMNYLIVTDEGRSYTGLLAAQNATTISLQRAEGEPIELLREEIEEMRSSGISLMPEGLEKEISVQQFADLLTYLMQAE